MIALTGIGQLDTLLSATEELSTMVLLIRGGAGTGKSTLALQIVHERLKRQPNAKQTSAAIFCLERDPREVIANARQQFDFELLHPRVRLVAREELENKYREPPVNTTPLADEAQRDRDTLWTHNLADAIRGCIPPSDAETMVVVIDSLNVLADVLLVSRRTGPNGPPSGPFDRRAAIVGLSSALHRTILKHDDAPAPKRTLIILTGEFHLRAGAEDSTADESFLCDVEILLAAEALVGSSQSPVSPMIGAGFHIESHPSRGGGVLGALASVELRPFLRVLKSRLGKQQSRRCSYSIQPKSGLRPGAGLLLDPIFPGDGQLILFQENERQRIEWDDLRANAARTEFVALRIETFDRPALQRTFATFRRLGSHTLATDLLMGSFDGYWIAWYEQLHRKHAILHQLRTVCAPDTAKGEAFAATACLIDECIEQQKLLLSASDTAPWKGLTSAITIAWEALSARLPEVKELLSGRATESPTPNEEVPSLVKVIEGTCEQLSNNPGVFKEFAPSEFRLFGEQRSPLLKELDNQERSVCRKASPGERPLFTVPYNANISFLVYRQDLLDRIYDKQKTAIRDRTRALGLELARQVKLFVDGHGDVLSALGPSVDAFVPPSLTKDDLQVLQTVPTTWEQVIATADVLRKDIVLETQTFDTFLCTFIEMLWACGGELNVSRDYRIADPVRTAAAAYQALLLLREMLNRKVVQRDSSVEVDAFARRYRAGARDWVFCRQWHSTLVDLLTAKNGKGEWAWEPRDGDRGSRRSPAHLEIVPLPTVLVMQAVARSRGDHDGKSLHHGCWGEWHLAASSGSENHDLAVELVNNLMSSQKIIARALACAALPTVGDFYRPELYGGTRCVRIPERDDIILPSFTFLDLKEKIFPFARRRGTVFDYRHSTRFLHGVLERLFHHPGVTEDELAAQTVTAFSEIRALERRGLMTH